MSSPDSGRFGSTPSGAEKRRHRRINVNVAVSCVSISPDGSPLDQNKGFLKDISIGGAAIEADAGAMSDRMVLVFTDADSRVVGILGRVAYSRDTGKGNYAIGVSFLADAKESGDFIARAVRLYHYYKGAVVD